MFQVFSFYSARKHYSWLIFDLFPNIERYLYRLESYLTAVITNKQVESVRTNIAVVSKEHSRPISTLKIFVMKSYLSFWYPTRIQLNEKTIAQRYSKDQICLLTDYFVHGKDLGKQFSKSTLLSLFENVALCLLFSNKTKVRNVFSLLTKDFVL